MFYSNIFFNNERLSETKFNYSNNKLKEAIVVLIRLFVHQLLNKQTINRYFLAAFLNNDNDWIYIFMARTASLFANNYINLAFNIEWKV